MVRWFVLMVVVLGLCGTLAFAQVFPEEENLDVVYIADGSVLRGRIIENFIDRYVKIEIYGGTTFIVAYENIDAIEEEPNPDYNMQWIRVEVGDLGNQLTDGSDENPGATAVASRDEERPFLGQGWLVGIYGVFGMNGILPGHSEGLSGKDWDTITNDLEGKDAVAGVLGGGLYGSLLRPLNGAQPEKYLWGVRGGLGYYYGHRSFKSPYVDTRDDVYLNFLFLDIPAEALIGIGGPRAFVYLSGGFSLSIITSPPDDSWGADPAIYDFPEFDNPVNPGVIGSVGTMFRLGRNWTGDFRVFFQRQLTSWYSDFEQYYNQAPGFSLGAAYHRKR